MRTSPTHRTHTPVMPRGARIQPLHIIAANEVESNKATLEAVRKFYEKAVADPHARPEYVAYCQRRVAFHERQISEYQAMLGRIYDAHEAQPINTNGELRIKKQ